MPPKAVGEKRALVVGCNYPGTEATLRGCVNDAQAINKMLTTHFGFAPNNIEMLVDTGSGAKPTGAQIKQSLKKLVAASKPGDVLVFHFSGHGTQIQDKSGGEADNMDEAICPTDMNLICDDDLHAIFAPLPPTVYFTMISDCCHSGSMLDHPVQQISGDKDPSAPKGVDDVPERDLMGAFFKGAPGADDAKNRSLPQDLFSKILGSKLGTTIDPTNVKKALAKGFGGDASNKMLSAAGMLQGQLDKMAGGGGAHAKKAGMVSKLLGMCTGGNSTRAPADSAASVQAGQKAGHAQGGGGNTAGSGGGGGVAGVPGNSGAGQQAASGGTGAEKKPATGVLITGCQSNETSADACPSGDPSKAFGALTNALTTTINAVKRQNPNAMAHNHFVVQQVRKTLLKAGFEQNPCLECAPKDTKAAFICP